jgi:hypothetical protein
MDRKCKNCEHFRQGSAGPTRNVWGDCVKPGKYTRDGQDTKTLGVFLWGGKNCADFEPRKTLADQPAQDIL